MSFHTLEAGKTRSLDIPISSLMEGSSVEVDKVGIGLFGVPANQYTTLFLDDVALSCTQDGAATVTGELGEESPEVKAPTPSWTWTRHR